MDLWQKIKSLFKVKKEDTQAPLLIIQKDSDGTDTKEYRSIEEAIIDLEKDPNVPKDKLEKIKASLDNLKHKSTIKIRNGEIED